MNRCCFPPPPNQRFSTSNVCARSWKPCLARFYSSTFGHSKWMRGMKDRTTSPAQAVTSPASVAHLAVSKTRTPETPNRARRSTAPNLHTFATFSCQSLPLNSLVSLPPTPFPSPRTGLFSLHFVQAGGAETDTTSRAAHLFSSNSTSLPVIATIFICKKAHYFPF